MEDRLGTRFMRVRRRLDRDVSTGTESDRVREARVRMESERRRVTLFQQPLKTITLFLSICVQSCFRLVMFALRRRVLVLFALLVFGGIVVLVLVEGPHSAAVLQVAMLIRFSLWWLVLGVLSSIGLGTGLHTFVLYLGPFIVKTTLAAIECGSVQFDLMGTEAFFCSDEDPSVNPTVWDILLKVQPASVLWGLGTALGELPPYFISRAARNSGARIEEIDQSTEEDPGWIKSAKSLMMKILDHYGFCAIILFASVILVISCLK